MAYAYNYFEIGAPLRDLTVEVTGNETFTLGYEDYREVETDTGYRYETVQNVADAQYTFEVTSITDIWGKEASPNISETYFGSISTYGTNQWHIDDESGTSLSPDVGSVSATISGSQEWVSDPGATGQYHLSHNGTDVEWTTDSGVLTTPFTVAGWVRFDDMTGFENPIMWNGSDNTNGERLYISSDGDGALLTLQGGGSVIRGHSFVSTGDWGFFGINVQSDQHTLYTWSENQELAESTGTHDNNGLGTNRKLYVGVSDTDYFAGDTDFYVVSDGSSLTKAELTELWKETRR